MFGFGNSFKPSSTICDSSRWNDVLRQKMDKVDEVLESKTKYSSKENAWIQKDTAQAFLEYPSLKPMFGACVNSKGKERLYLYIYGKLPIMCGDKMYHLPIEIWFLDKYPKKEPLCFIKPSRSMRFVPGHAYVSSHGVVKTPYLQSWKHKTHTVLGLLENYGIEFSQNPPVYGKTIPVCATRNVDVIQELEHAELSEESELLNSLHLSSSVSSPRASFHSTSSARKYKENGNSVRFSDEAKEKGHRRRKLKQKVAELLQEEINIIKSDKEADFGTQEHRKRDLMISEQIYKQESKQYSEAWTQQEESLCWHRLMLNRANIWIREHSSKLEEASVDDLIVPTNEYTKTLFDAYARLQATKEAREQLIKAIDTKDIHELAYKEVLHHLDHLEANASERVNICQEKKMLHEEISFSGLKYKRPKHGKKCENRA